MNKHNNTHSSKWLLILGCFFFAAVAKASTVYTWSDGSTMIVTVNSADHWMLQQISADGNQYVETGIITQRGAYSQVSQLVAAAGSPSSVWNNDGSYSDILQCGVAGHPSGSHLNTNDDGYYLDGIGRFNEYSNAPAPGEPTGNSLYVTFIFGNIYYVDYVIGYQDW